MLVMGLIFSGIPHVVKGLLLVPLANRGYEFFRKLGKEDFRSRSRASVSATVWLS